MYKKVHESSLTSELWHFTHPLFGCRVPLWSIGYPSMMLWTIPTAINYVETNFKAKHIKTRSVKCNKR